LAIVLFVLFFFWPLYCLFFFSFGHCKMVRCYKLKSLKIPKGNQKP
jgi:ABC-type sugar transport system permease subunit